MSLNIPTFRASIHTKSEEKSDNMSPFAIFAIVLTLAYIIYYGVMISRDLMIKPGQEESHEETIDTESFDQAEAPTAVKSVGEGFQIGDGPVHQPEPLPEVISLDSDGNVTAEGMDDVMSSELRRRVGESVEEMEDIDVDSQPQVDEETYAKQMEKRHGFSIDETQDKF